MNKSSLSDILKAIQPFVDSIKIPGFSKVFSLLLNFIENLVSENEEQKIVIQKQKDEISRLKGEQGKPEINPNTKKDGDVSSEKERKDAETSAESESNRVGFKLSKATINKLKETGLPSELLEQLQKISHQKYSDKLSFVDAIETEIGRPLSDEYRLLLFKYACYHKRSRNAKIPLILIDREENCQVDKTLLPKDAEFKGYEKKTVQDIILMTDNVLFNREIFYSPSLNKTYLGNVPIGYEGDFGPQINGNIITMKYVNGMSIPKIEEFFKNIGIYISRSTISCKLSKPQAMDIFHKEKADLFKAVLESFKYMQIDDTGTRVNGKNYYTQIFCNKFYTLFFTTKQKDRLTILDILRNFRPRTYLLNNSTIPLLEKMGVIKSNISLLTNHMKDEPYNEKDFLSILKEIYGEKNQRVQTRVLEASAICSYHAETGFNIVQILVCDDAPQFKLLTILLALCWVHNGRHYKRLNPITPIHQEMLKAFLQRFWDYYGKLHLYKKNPNPTHAEILSKEFDELFSTKTGYDELDDRIEKSKNQKAELLVVLTHPDIPLHNNISENAARVEKRRQDVSFQTITLEGTMAKDTMMSTVDTCKKLGISAYKYILDRVSGTFAMQSLSEMIQAKANPTVNSP